jgi:hypothetical protein
MMGLTTEKGWFARNWKWFVPLACVWGLAVVAGFAALMLYLVFGLVKSSDVCKEALARAKANPSVVMALGTPIREGLFVAGSIRVSGPSGEAELEIPISGPKGKGAICLDARKSAGRWSFTRLLVELGDHGESIDLLKPGELPERPGQGPSKGSEISI